MLLSFSRNKQRNCNDRSWNFIQVIVCYTTQQIFSQFSTQYFSSKIEIHSIEIRRFVYFPSRSARHLFLSSKSASYQSSSLSITETIYALPFVLSRVSFFSRWSWEETFVLRNDPPLHEYMLLFLNGGINIGIFLAASSI